MAVRRLRQLAAVVALALLLVRPSDLVSCGPYFRIGLLTRVGIPENEKAFFSGQLGILQPTWWRRYLAMSYRILQGVPLSASQVASLGPPPSAIVEQKPENAPAARWDKARRQVPGTVPAAALNYRYGDDFTQYKNCGDDAFLTAVTTLNERIRSAGAASPEVRDWLAAQDVVFSNCNGKADIPPPARSGSSPRILADRDYQIAAAHFYAGHLAEAKELFRKIADDTSSPWHTIAPYLAVRTDIRKGDYELAQSELQAILANPQLADIHARSTLLLNYVDARLDPAARFVACSKRLLIPDSATLGQDLADYTFLYDRFTDSNSTSMSSLMAHDDLASWIEQFRGGTEDEIVNRWQRDHSLPWLVAALYRASDASSHAAELIDAARQVPFDSPGWPTVRFHAVRLLIEMGRNQEAREILHDVSPHLQGAGASTVNGFRAERMKTAVNLGEFLDATPRRLAGDETDGISGESDVSGQEASKPLFDDDAAMAFNAFLPLNLWLASIRDTRLPGETRTVLAQAGFARAAVLDSPLAPGLARLLRELKPAFAADMDRYLAAPRDRRLSEALLWLVHYPGVSTMLRSGLGRGVNADLPDRSVDPFRDNWWCAAKASVDTGSPPKVPSPVILQLYSAGWKPPSFLTAQDREQAATELKALAAVGGAPAFFSRSALAWTRNHPDDPRLPEALGLAVKSSRYGCTDPDSAVPVSEAFRVLHNRFPDSHWAKDTPYWFK